MRTVDAIIKKEEQRNNADADNTNTPKKKPRDEIDCYFWVVSWFGAWCRCLSSARHGVVSFSCHHFHLHRRSHRLLGGLYASEEESGAGTLLAGHFRDWLMFSLGEFLSITKS